MTMAYNKMSSPVVFNQSIFSEGTTTFKNNTYHYNSDIQPNAPIQIGEMHYTYDAAGNPTSILDTNGIGKDLEWNADNQLRSIVDTKEGLFHSYAYDHTGERILKRYGTAQNAYYNGKDMCTLHDFGESYSAYASAYFVENNNGYTKHYYAGATRLVSKLGEGYYENNELVSTGMLL
jgi:YD repeat-containing protein